MVKIKKKDGMREHGHLPVLQAIVSSRSGQAAPPFSGSWTTSLTLVLVPLLQVALHSPQAVQSLTLQSTGNMSD